jgi:hypothetical protein
MRQDRSTATKETHVAQRVTAWVGWVWFAAFAILVAGFFNIVAGLVAVFSEKTVVSWNPDGVAVVDVSTWGWVHLVLGVLLVLVSFALFAGRGWARVVALLLVVLNLFAQFVSLPVTPWWALTAIVLDVLILWALTVHGDEVARAAR